MSKEMIWDIEQLQGLFKYVKEADLDDTVFAGWTDLQDGQPPQQVIGSHLCAEISAAIKLVEEFCGKDDLAIAKLMKCSKETSVLKEATLISKHIKRPTPDKVFREVKQD
ncbi:hypothetical protein HDV02_002447, partial [Globomyces sp. JEL0801]